MARQVNPYYADAGRRNPMSQGVNNLASLGQMFLAGPDPAARAGTLSSAWDARRNKEEVTDIVGRRSGRETLGDAFANYTPEQGIPAQQILSETVRSNAMNPDDLGTLFRVAAGNLPGVSDERRQGAWFGAGHETNPDTAFSIGDREGVSARESREDRALQQLREDAAMERQVAGDRADASQGPTSRDELLTHLFLNQGPEAAATARPQLYGESGSSSNPWLEATRRSGVEETIDKFMERTAGDMGVDPSNIPPELRNRVIQGAMRAVRERGASPRAAVGELFERYNVTEEDPWFGAPRLEYDLNAEPEPQRSPEGSMRPASRPIPGETVYRDPDTGVQWRYVGGDPNSPNSWEQQ